jgi:hypothetical protein
MSGLASLFIGKAKESKHQGTQDAPETYKKNYKILFVDDEENVLSAMRRIFRRENYTGSCCDLRLQDAGNERIRAVAQD